VYQDAGVAVMVQTEVQIVVDPMEVFDGCAPSKQVCGRRFVNVFWEFIPLIDVFVIDLALIAKAIGIRTLVAPPDVLGFHVE
jgi:hypothetical protein